VKQTQLGTGRDGKYRQQKQGLEVLVQILMAATNAMRETVDRGEAREPRLIPAWGNEGPRYTSSSGNE
jgi:hypothetical protein